MTLKNNYFIRNIFGINFRQIFHRLAKEIVFFFFGKFQWGPLDEYFQIFERSFFEIFIEFFFFNANRLRIFWKVWIKKSFVRYSMYGLVVHKNMIAIFSDRLFVMHCIINLLNILRMKFEFGISLVFLSMWHCFISIDNNM